MRNLFPVVSIFVLIFLPTRPVNSSVQTETVASVTYYVSTSSGSDSNNGLSSAAPFATVTKVNTLNLQPGDRVLFKCGDTWRADPLVINESGTPAAPIEFNSYPLGCANKPSLSGSKPVTGWTQDSGNVYRADLSSVDFPLGINQLFRGGMRLTLGRWPNLDAPNGGYSTVDGHAAGGNTLTDNELPAGNWAGAIVHIKNIRWSMLDRQVTASASHSLTLNKGLSCLVESWGDCAGWGYFINNSHLTLDQDGEWFYDSAARRVYLYSTAGAPANIEGSLVQADDHQGGVMLSGGAATAYVIVDNLEIKNWGNHGISAPAGMNGDIYHDITVRNVTVRDVDGAGIFLSSWTERPSDGIKSLRGGHHLTFANNLIDGANSFGVSGYFHSSTFTDNTIRNIALVKNLGKSGMGCGLTSDECTENGDGFRIRLHVAATSGFGNTLRDNRIEKTGYNGVDVFGPETILENNFTTQACFTKADCGAVRVFGSDSLAATTVYNVHLLNNIIVDIPGNVDGCPPSRAAFGMGLYIDNYSRNVEARGNTVIDTTVSGILYQHSTGQAVGNTVYNASSGSEYSAQIDLSGGETQVSLSGNVMYALKSNAWTLYAYSYNNAASSDQNYFFHPYVSKHIAYGPSWTRYTFADWQAKSGRDVHSKTNWFTQPVGEASRAVVFYNAGKSPLTVDLSSREYLDLDQVRQPVSLVLQPFTSKILVDNGPAVLALLGIYPAMLAQGQVGAFTLAVSGKGFTAGSVVRWNGADRPTTFVSSTHLDAAISAADVGALGSYPVIVHDPAGDTAPMNFYVVEEVHSVYLPLMQR
ncbi:MAG TPA: right-handed parallel beta-helix repeat-containing protein [Anaerolineaceae bacterium]|nr:right-handed parallel beta-helix repeat-containing protein [Anaerolineaceae bacterium]